MLYKLALRKKTIVEIGSYLGASACCFGAALHASNIKEGEIYCVDTWKNDAMSEGGRDTYEEFLTNTTRYNDVIIPVRGYSTAMAEKLAQHQPTIDLLFVDGDHSYEGVKADWEAYKKSLAPNSTVIFHDWGWAEGVKRVVTEDVAPLTKYRRFGSLSNMWWGILE